MIYVGIGFFLIVSFVFVRMYVNQDFEIMWWQNIIWALFYVCALVYFYYYPRPLEDIVAIGLMSLLLIGTVETDLKLQKVNITFVVMFIPAILGYRVLFVQYLSWLEWITMIMGLVIGSLLCYFSKHFLSNVDWLVVGYGLLLFGVKKSLVIFILSLIFTVIAGGIVFLLGKGKRNLKLPYIPMYALGFWVSLFLI